MPGLLAAQHGAPPLHLFEHIFIAHRRPQHLDALSRQRALQSQVRHHRRHHQIARQMSVRLQFARRDQQDVVSVDDFAARGDQDGAVRIAIERDAPVGVGGQHFTAQIFNMQCAAVQIDVPTVRMIGDRDHFRSCAPEQIRRQMRCRAVAAIEHQP